MEKTAIMEVLDSIASRVPRGTDTYTGEDGLLYCANCNTAQQSRIEVFGVTKVVPCVCKCMQEARQREEERQARLDKMQEVRRFRDMGFTDRDMMAHTFAADDGANPALTRAAHAYVDHFKEFRKAGKGLLLYGSVGTGKSFVAACIVNALIDMGYPCLMTNFSRLIDAVNAQWGERQTYLDSLSRFELIAIDDLGVERDTGYTNENVTVIVDSLYRAKVPLIITSNYTPKQLTGEDEIRRKRVYDRLLERCHPIEVTGESRRKEKGRKDYATMKEILGL